MGIKGANLKNESLLQIFAAVCGFSIVLNVLLTRKLPTFLSRLNEISNSQPPLISFKRLAPSNARARDAKLVLSFKTLTKYRALSDLLRSLIVLRVPRQMLSIA